MRTLFQARHQRFDTLARGAKTAMTVALRARTEIGNLISVDNAPVDAALKSDFAKYCQGMRRIEDSHVQRQSEADEILKEYEEVRLVTNKKGSNTKSSLQSLPIRQFLLTNLYRAPDSDFLTFRIPIRTLAASLDNMAGFPFTDPDEARFEGPALFIRGTKSHYCSDDVLPVIGRFFPLFELRDIEAGHWVISENPEAFRSGESRVGLDESPLIVQPSPNSCKTRYRLYVTHVMVSCLSYRAPAPLLMPSFPV